MTLQSMLGIVQTLTPLIGVLAAVSGVVAAIFAIRQYAMQNSQKRAEMFFAKRDTWFESRENVAVFLENDDPRLATEVPWEKREALLGFYEELALSVNSGLLREDVANYMFGYYVVKVWKSKHFWTDLDDPGAGYWKLFTHFARRMEVRQKEFEAPGFDPTKLRF